MQLKEKFILFLTTDFLEHFFTKETFSNKMTNLFYTHHDKFYENV